MQDLIERFEGVYKKLGINEKKKRVEELTELSMKEDFWKNSEDASKKMTELSDLKDEIEKIEILNLYKEEGNLQEFDKGIKELERLAYLSKPYDKGEALFSIHSLRFLSHCSSISTRILYPRK